jgi:hypothetical protein
VGAAGRRREPPPSDGTRDGSDLQSFAPVARRANLVQGPLFVFGGLDPDPAYNTSLEGYLPILLPGESSSSPLPVVLPTARVDESKQVDRLIVHNEDSPADDVGTLTSNRITGLGMGPDLYVAGRLFPGGIAYAGLEALEIYLGYGDDTFTVESTHAGTTLISAGRGNDTVHVKTVAGHTVVYGGDGDDRVNVGAPTTGGQTVDQIRALLAIDGGSGFDRVFVDDGAETQVDWATLTPTSLTGLDMAPGTDKVWVLRPGTADVLTLVVAGYGYLQFTVGRAPTAAEAMLGMRELTADNLADAIQKLMFPRGMEYTGGPLLPGQFVRESDFGQTGCGALGTSDCAPSVWVWKVGRRVPHRLPRRVRRHGAADRPHARRPCRRSTSTRPGTPASRCAPRASSTTGWRSSTSRSAPEPA